MDPLCPLPHNPLFPGDTSLLPGTVTATNIKQLPLHSASPVSPPLLSPLPRRSCLKDSSGNITAQHEPPLLPYTHENNTNNQSIVPNIWSPADVISHPTEPSQGYGRLRHLDRIKREQYANTAHEPLVVKWDMLDLSSIIGVLEACNVTQKARKPWMSAQDKRDVQASLSTNGNLQKLQQDQQSKFDPRAPHFDVILVDLTNAPPSPCQIARKDTKKDIGSSETSSELNLPAKGSGPNGFLGPKNQHNPPAQPTSGLSPTITKGVKKASQFREDINDLPMESLAGRPGWLFLWVGATENMVAGRRILARFGFRKVECIGWVKTTNGRWKEIDTNQSNDNIQYPPEPTGRGVLRRGIEWCLVGVKGTAKRTYDSHLIHCNVNTDVIISDGPEAPKSSLLSKIIENFSQGQRRLHLFANPGDERAGWVCVGKDFEETTFDCKKYMKFWDDRGKHGWLMPFDPEVEYFRPKTPPLQVRKRERAGLSKKSSHGGNNNNRGELENELPKFPHPGQRKRPVVRYFCPEDDPKHQKKPVTTTVTIGKKPSMPENGNKFKPAMGSYVAQVSSTKLKPQANYQNHQNQSQNLRRASEPLLKSPEPAKQSPTAKHFLPKAASQEDPKLTYESGSIESQPDHSHVAEPSIVSFSGYVYQPSGQLSKDLSKAPSFPSTPSTSPPAAPYQTHFRQSRPLPLSSGYPSTGPPSLSSRFGNLSMYGDSRQSESPTPHSNYPPGNTPRNFLPVYFPPGGPGRIKTANAARLATFPPVFRTEYRQSRGLPCGYYGNMNSVAATNPEYPQRPFGNPGGYGSTSIELGGNLDCRTPSQYQTLHYQQLAVRNTPLIDPNQGPPHQYPQGPQGGGYTGGYGQPHQQPQLQQIPSAPYPAHEFHPNMQNQQQQQQPQFGQYGAYGLQDHQQQQQQQQFEQYGTYGPQNQQQQQHNALKNMWFLGSQADYKPQMIVAGNQSPATFP